MFRYRVSTKLNRLKEFNKESYEFMKMSLEIQAFVQSEIDQRVQLTTQAMSDEIKKLKEGNNKTLEYMSELRFDKVNAERREGHLARQTDDAMH